MKNLQQNNGFTLVELIVSVGITAVLMVGISTFFSSTFQNMFTARGKVANAQEQSVVNTILSEKFVDAEKLQKIDINGFYAVIRNDMDTGDLPFTYIGRDGQITPPFEEEGHVVFKDFFVFNGKDRDYASFATGIKNPAGIYYGIANHLYVTAPLENKIYDCTAVSPLINCQPTSSLNVTGLNQPMDMDYDMANTLYVADAGNDRIIAIDLNTLTVTPIASDLNYPTGIAYYSSIKSGKKYLFVADTYNHLIKRIDLSDNSIETVVGAGDDEDCNTTPTEEHTALFCKLHFPTDVMIQNNELYIADTGNDRILKVTDPAPDLSNYELPLSLDESTEVDHVDFELPAGSTIGSVTEGDPNTFHKVKYDSTNPVITASLTGQTTGNYMVCPGDPMTCTNYFRGFYVNNENNIFRDGDSLDILGSPYSVDGEPVFESGKGWKVVMHETGTIIDPLVGSDVRITTEFSGNSSFFLNLTNVTFLETFNKIQVKAYDDAAENKQVNSALDSVTIRIGDGVLGTPEDTISVVLDSGLDFPTGLGWDIDGLETPDPPQFSPEYFDNFDYTSDFLTQNFGFDTSNGDNILELKFDAQLGEDAEGKPLWTPYTLNADVTP